VRGGVRLRLVHHDFLGRTDHTPPLGQSWLKRQRYKPVPSWSVGGWVTEMPLHRRYKPDVPPIRRSTVKQVLVPLLDDRRDVNVRRVQGLREKERQDHGWRFRILRSNRVAEEMKPAEYRRGGGMSSGLSKGCMNRIRTIRERYEGRLARTRLRVVIQVRQQRLEIFNRDAQLDWDDYNWGPNIVGSFG